ncbi:MAG: sulfatase-like hydrolase/transferase [Armatimonadia bacterium]|nr:sulfatase-like hydrolase/transferase [Armatimonadia bacterium]
MDHSRPHSPPLYLHRLHTYIGYLRRCSRASVPPQRASEERVPGRPNSRLSACQEVWGMPLSRRKFMGTVAAGTLAGGLAGAARSQAARPRNVLFIMTDQQPTATLGCYGNPLDPTPNLDGLARSAVRYRTCCPSGFPCSPARASMLTGLYPHAHGVVTNDVPLTDEVPSMGFLLQSAGLATGYFGKWHLGGHMYRLEGEDSVERGHWRYRRVPSDQGFRFEKVPGGVGEDQPQLGFETWRGGWLHYKDYLRRSGLGELVEQHPTVGNHNDLPSAPEGQHMVSLIPQEHHMAAFFAEEAESFILGSARAGQAFGAVVSFYGPHLPVAPPKPWDTRYSLDDVSLPANIHDDLSGKPLRQRMNTRCHVAPRWSEDQFRDYIRRYYGYSAYIDQQIGRVLRALETAGVADETLVIFTADHGDMMAGHGFIFKMGTCGYEELFNVPLLVRAPGVSAEGTGSDALVGQVDLLPTILEWLGEDAAEGMHGESFLGQTAEPGRPFRRRLFSDSIDHSIVTRDRRHKFVLNWRNRDLDELYDLQADPGELDNLVDRKPGEAERHRHYIEEWLTETDHPYRSVVLSEAAKEARAALVEARPEVSHFRDLGDGRIEMSVTWHVDAPIEDDIDHWCFTQFLNPDYGTDGTIAFRMTPWPETPTSQWRAGEAYTVGPVVIDIPDSAGPGDYDVVCGLYNPDEQRGPGALAGGHGNRVQVGRLVIEGTGEGITEVRYVPE